MNYKVKVENEAESKEVQYLGEQLGYVKSQPPNYISMKNGGYVCLGFNYDGVQEDLILLIGGFRESDMSDIKDYKELTIPQLKDLVVLKRNDKSDATHRSQSGFKWFVCSDNKIHSYSNKQWVFISDDLIDLKDLKPIEKKEMKEFLVNHDNKWTLQLLDADTEENSYRVALPSGATFYAEDSNMGVRGNYFFRLRSDDFDDEAIYLNGNWMRASFDVLNMIVLWQRSETEYLMQGENGDKLMESVAELKGQETVKVTIDELKHRVYKKDVSHLDSIDVYRVLELFNVQSHAVGHAIKKLLCSGGRGAKDEAQDIQEAIDSLIRYQEMKNED